jgi:excisionase family DNA binding protein
MIQIGTLTAYSVPEAAERLRMKEETVRIKIRSGELKANKVGTRFHVTEENLQSFVAGEATQAEREAKILERLERLEQMLQEVLQAVALKNDPV